MAVPARSDPDVVIVGGGVAGLFCAYFLRRAGATVTVLERGALGGPQSCSSGNTGFVGTHGAAPLAEPGLCSMSPESLAGEDAPLRIRQPLDRGQLHWLWHFRRACTAEAAADAFRSLVSLKKRSLDILVQLCAAEGLAELLSSPGIVLAFKSKKAFEDAKRGVPRAVAGGVPLRALEPGELDELEPKTRFEIHGSLYNPEGAHLHVPEFVVEFGRILRALGVEILEHANVVGFRRDGSRVNSIKTTRGDLRPGDVVLAAGSWSPELARMLGREVLLQPVKGHSVTVEMPADGPTRPILLSESRVAMVPLGDRLRFGGQLELAGMSTSIEQERVQAILRSVREYLPQLEQTRVIETWSGLRPCTPDSLPLIGRLTGLRNVLIAAGYGHIGMGLAPAGGELISQLIAGEQPTADPAPLSPDRFHPARRSR